jgi:hypothetical protein
MARLFRTYSQNVERVWYDSSNILYSECDDRLDNFKILKVVFKNGRQYQYNDINVNDYLLFREDLSQGKALNKLIKPKYEAIRLDDVDVDLLMEEYARLLDEDDADFTLTITESAYVFEGKNDNSFIIAKTDNLTKDIISILKSFSLKVKGKEG